jgi:hypothetical protein
VKKHLFSILLAVVIAGAGARHTFAQAPEQKAGADRAAAEEARQRAADQERRVLAAVTPLQVEVVVSRYQGDKKTGSQTYTMNVNATPSARVQGSPVTVVKIGSQVPLPNFAPPTGPDGKPLTPLTGGGPVVFKEIGTQIDCRARPLDDGRYELQVSVEETNVAPAGESGTRESINLPVLKTFQASNNLILRDGQTQQFVVATDRVTGEVVKVDVTMRVGK